MGKEFLKFRIFFTRPIKDPGPVPDQADTHPHHWNRTRLKGTLAQGRLLGGRANKVDYWVGGLTSTGGKFLSTISLRGRMNDWIASHSTETPHRIIL